MEIQYRMILFWGVWLTLPLIMEIFIGTISGITLIIKKAKKKSDNQLSRFPSVCILVPVYKSVETLEKCLYSIANQTYDISKISIYLLNNGPEDGSYEVFKRFQKKNQEIKIWWINTLQGKSKALNVGLYRSKSEYVINLDSDGWLDEKAIYRTVSCFEKDQKINAMTGVILIDPELINNTKKLTLKILRKCEFFEYSESFLVGRNFSSIFNKMYTLAGAFSVFRRKALLNTHLYNFETVGEDTHMTFQIRKNNKGKIKLCSDAYFYVDPISDINHLYIQRQRWQRGQLEVARLHSDMHLGRFYEIIKKFALRIIILDHTLAFPRMMWFFGMIYLYIRGYPINLLLISNLLLYGLYVFNGMIFFAVSYMHLNEQVKAKQFLAKNILIIFLMPFYRILYYLIRLAGIINSTARESKWETATITDEISIMRITKNKVYEKTLKKWVDLLYESMHYKK